MDCGHNLLMESSFEDSIICSTPQRWQMDLYNAKSMSTDDLGGNMRAQLNLLLQG